jgi:hypothetical protein
MGRVSMATKGELLAAIGDRYRASSRAERTRILDEFVAVTGYHRKHAIRLLRPKAEPFDLVQRQVHRVMEPMSGRLWLRCGRLLTG